VTPQVQLSPMSCEITLCRERDSNPHALSDSAF
jgi:hypothetical protein